MTAEISFRTLSPDGWPALEDLFGPERGASGGCWCMWWRLSSAEFGDRQRDARRDAFRALIDNGTPLGVLAFEGDRAVGWCAIGPRSTLPKLQRSRVAKPAPTLASEQDRV